MSVHNQRRGRLNKRMQPTALQVKGTLDRVQADQSPQLMRGPLGRTAEGVP
jgi:hypothetical protein